MDSNKSSTPTIVALVFLIGFGIYVIHMAQIINVDDKIWTRNTYLLGGIEAVAFAGAGFLFGKEVHRGQAESAEKRADKAEKAAINGIALAEAIKARVPANGSGAAALRSAQSTNEAQRSLADLAALANKLFP